MSRSRKKIAIWKQHNDQFYKRISNKRFRKRPIELTNTKPLHFTDSWDIYDFKWFPDSNDKKATRK